MSDIERRLRDLGEKVRSEQGLSALGPKTIRAAKRRRISTAFTGLVALVALVFGATFAAGAFSPERSKLGPATVNSDVLIEYRRSGGFEGSDTRLTVDTQGNTILNYTLGTGDLTVEGALSQLELEALQEAIAAVDWPAMHGFHELPGGVGVVDGYEYEIRHDDYVVSTTSGAEPREIKPLIELLDAVASQTARGDVEKPGECGPPVDFEPSYLPEGWVRELQEGGAGGKDPFGNIAGHYGAEASASDHEKVDAGFINVVAPGSRFEPPGEGDLIVLGEPAEFDEENGTIEFGSDGCAYVLVGAGVGRDELVPFAEALRPKGSADDAVDDGREESFGAVWPSDSYELARQACDSTEGFLADPTSAALEFGRQVLGWNGGARLVEGSNAERENAQVRLLRSESESEETFVLVDLWEFEPDCWIVLGVQRSPDESQRYQEHEGASLSVRGREAQTYFADFQDGASAIVEIGYGGESTQHLWESGDEFVEFRLDFEPNGQGHYLILLRDENGDVFSAFGSPLPAGNFAAG